MEAHRDMLLIEHQLPFLILEFKILDFAKNIGPGISEQCTIRELTHRFFSAFVEQEGLADNLNSSEIRHFVDFLQLIHLPAEKRQPPKNNRRFETVRSLTELHEAGVRFKLASTNKLLRIQFKDGVLKIPRIYVHDGTETYFRNILAYDQCHHGFSQLGDYIGLVHMLVRTPDDVELLLKNGILKNALANSQEVSKLFNNLDREIKYNSGLFYYSHLCEELSEYCRIPRHKWMATLKHNYLNTPWAVISVFAASILLVLTLIQAVCAVISL